MASSVAAKKTNRNWSAPTTMNPNLSWMTISLTCFEEMMVLRRACFDFFAPGNVKFSGTGDTNNSRTCTTLPTYNESVCFAV